MKTTKLTIISVGLLLLPIIALAQPAVHVGSLQQMVNDIESAIWIVFGGIAVISFVVAGILFLVAAGNAEKVQQARNAFIWGVAGVVVGILAYSIIAIVSSMIR